MKEEKIFVYTKMNFSAKAIFDFIIKPENMVLYTGFLLFPGIKKVDSSDKVRTQGTVDKIINTDNSSHVSTTDILIPHSRYSLTLKNIIVTGFKKKLANPILGFREDWILVENQTDLTSIERSLYIQYKEGGFNHFLVRFFIRPQLYFSLLKHHQNILKSLSR